MIRQHRRWVFGLATAMVIAVAGCSGGSTPAPSTAGDDGAATVDVALAEWSVTPSTITAAPGSVTFGVSNTGTTVHELIVVKTDLLADALPVAGAKVDEAGLTVVDEVEDVAAGTTADLALTGLAAGHYVLFCNIEGHYSQGMHADFDVKQRPPALGTRRVGRPARRVLPGRDCRLTPGPDGPQCPVPGEGEMGGCCGEGIPSCERVFDRRAADRDLRRFRRKGAPWATRELIEELASGVDLADVTVLDVGAGVGAVHLGLLERGASSAVDVDGSGAYLATAREEAARRGLGDRVRHVLGDVTIVAPTIDDADLVALDRVVCCYGDVASLLTAASTLARRRLGLVYPRDRWWIRAGATLGNLVMFRRSTGYRMHVHRASTMAGLLRAAGFGPVAYRDGRVWRVETWERVAT